MSKSLIGVLGATLLLFSLTVVAVGQKPKTKPTTTPTVTAPPATTPPTTTTETTTTTKVQAIQNSDGTYTIVEYPVDKETVVTLNPVGLSGATGTATILRVADGTTIKLSLASLPTEITAMNLYAVDPSGKVTLLGPIAIAKGAGTFTASIPMTKFMLVTSPDDNLSAYNESTTVFFRSGVPTGLTVIPITNAVGEQVAAVAVPKETVAVVSKETVAALPKETVVVPTETVAVPKETVAVVPTETVAVATDYTVPMLGIPSFKKGDETKLKVNFSGAMEGARANIFIEPRKRGNATEVLMHLHNLKDAPKGTAYILWAVSPDNQFQRLGQIVNVKGRNEAEIKSETSFTDFGLLLTTEDLGTTKATIIKPAGHRVGVIEIIR